MKAQMNVSIDTDVLEYHRVNGSNLSQLVNDYLRSLMLVNNPQHEGSLENQVVEAEKRLLTAKQQLQAATYARIKKGEEKNKEQLKGIVDHLHKLNEQRLSNPFKQEQFVALFSKTCKEHNLTRKELLDYVEGAKAL